jgi:hypothetical protein
MTNQLPDMPPDQLLKLLWLRILYQMKTRKQLVDR